MLRLAGGRYLPRRRYNIAKLLAKGAIEDEMSAPGLWEAFPPQDFPDFIWSALDDPAALTRHSLNPRRVQRLKAMVSDLAPDLVILCDSTMGRMTESFAGERYKLVVAPHNMDSLLYASLAAATHSAAHRAWGMRTAAAFAAAERQFAKADQLWVCSSADAQNFAGLMPESRIKLVPNVIEAAERRSGEPSRTIVFIGPLSYHPNELAAFELVKISKILSERGVAHRLQLIGKTTPALRQVAAAAKSVEVLGYVADVAPYLNDAALVAAPLTVGSGTRIKLLEAMVWGLPVVTTAIGISGIDAEDNVHAVIEDDLTRFPDLIAGLLDQPDRASAIGARARDLVAQHYSPAAMRDWVGKHLHDLGLAVEAGHRPPHPAFTQKLQARFNRSARLLELSCVIATSAPKQGLRGRIEHRGNGLPNSAIRLLYRSAYEVLLEASVVLGSEVDPEDVQFKLLWRGALLLSLIAEPYVDERTTLLNVEISAEGTQTLIDLWTDDPTATLAADGATYSLHARSGLHSVQVSGLKEPNKTVPRTADDPGRSNVTGFDRWLKPIGQCSTRLTALRGCHEGEAAWLIGNGPSVRAQDLAALNGLVSFGFNRLHLAYPITDFRPTYTVSGDRQMIEDFGQEIVDQSAGLVFLADATPPPLVGDYIWLRQIATFPPVFSRDPGRVINPGGSSLFVALQIACFMGIRRFYIYGADFRFDYDTIDDADDKFRTACGDGNHFIANYRNGRPWCPPSFPDIALGFLAARRFIESAGGVIQNATRGGLLEIFERTSFEQALSDSRTMGS